MSLDAAQAPARITHQLFSLPVLSASATIALLALSLILAVGVLSATPLGHEALAMGVVAALVSATLGGFLVAVLARAPGEICAPATSIAVIYAALCADLVVRLGPHASIGAIWAALSLAVVLMGIIMAIAGWLRLADAIRFMPAPVSAGFVTGIGLLVMWSQLGPLLGLAGRLSTYRWPALVDQLKPASLVVGVVTCVTVWLYPKLAKKGQPPLVALVVGTAVYHLLGAVYAPEHLGPTLSTISLLAGAQSTFSAAWSHVEPTWLLTTALHVLPYSAFLALQAVMNAAVTAVGVGDIVGVRSDVNRTLKAQGAVNVFCGALAALPVCTVASVSLPAARMRGATAVVPAASAVILLVAVLVAGGLLAYIPIAVLAGLLIMAGAAMIDRWAHGLARQLWRGTRRDTHLAGNLLVVAAVAAALFFGSVPIALLVGAVLAMVLLAVSLSEATSFHSEDSAQFASARVWGAEQARWLAGERAHIAIFRPRGGLFFGTAGQLAEELAALRPATKFCVIDLSRLTTLDATGCRILATGTRKLTAAGTVTLVAGVDPSRPRGQGLIALGLTFPEPETHWFEDLDHALEWIETRLLEKHWPDLAANGAIPLADSALTRDFSPSDLGELRACLDEVEHAAGALFNRGDPGTSMYVIDQGVVEIRIWDEAGKPTRLAAFGPGGIFGEIAMLTSEERTADAVCVVPTRLYALRREALESLRERSPRLHARIIENLNTHLANRLIVATSIVQTLR